MGAARTAIGRHGGAFMDVPVVELNEAFAAPAESCCRELGIDWRDTDREKVNPNGGAIALGHPIAASLATLIIKAIYELRRLRRSLRPDHGMLRWWPGSGDSHRALLGSSGGLEEAVGSTNLLVEEEDGYVVVVVGRPPVNAINMGTWDELRAVLERCATTDDVRAIVITGSGEKVFSGGADLTELVSTPVEEILGLVRKGHEVLALIEHYPKPVIAAIQGGAYGGGLELAMACHLRVMSSSAQLGQPEVRLGLVPGYGGSQRLPRLVGKTRALDMILTGDAISADQAMAYGLVSRVAEADVVLAEAKALAARLAAAPPIALEQAAKAINEGLETTLEEGLRVEERCYVTCYRSEDAQEGIKGFLEKRRPSFKGT